MTENEVYVAFQSLFDKLNEHYDSEAIEDHMNGALYEWLEENHPEVFEEDGE